MARPRRRRCSASRRRPTCRRAVFGEPFHESLVHEAARADLAARRRGTASTLGRGEVSMTGAKAWRQKGTGRARVGALELPTRRGGGAAFGPKPRQLHLQGQPQGAPPGAARRALRARRARHASPCSTPPPSRSRRPSRPPRRSPSGARAPRPWSSSTPRRSAAQKSFRNIPRVSVVPASAVGVADVVGARSLRGLRAAPLEVLKARAGERRSAAERTPDGRPPGDHRAGRLREELRADGRRQVHVPGRTTAPTRPRSRTRSRRSSASTSPRCAPPRCARSRSAAACTAARTRSWKKAIVQLAPGRADRALRGRGGRRVD